MEKVLRHHPDVHAPVAKWSEEETLHVACVYSNPFRWRTRRELANDFRRHMMQSPNVVIHVGELAYGDRPFDVTDPELHPTDVQLRTTHELFHKENIANQVIRTFPRDWKYGAIIDMDFHFTRHDWALETIHQLQMYEWVQCFSSYADISGDTVLGQGHQVIAVHNSFAFNWHKDGLALPPGYLGKLGKPPAQTYYEPYPQAQSGKKYSVGVGATGGAWAFRRAAFDTVGGFLDRCILGSGDWFMALGLVQQVEETHAYLSSYTQDYRDYIMAWQKRAARCTRNVGYVDGFATHMFHGPKAKRGYSSRNLLLVEHEYEPSRDVHPDWQGILQLSPDKPRLRDHIRRYFLERNEDMPHMG